MAYEKKKFVKVQYTVKSNCFLKQIGFIIQNEKK